MADLADRIQNLTPAQRELLFRRMQERGRTDRTGSPWKQEAQLASHVPSLSSQMAFSLFFFSADGTTGEENRYELLMQCARFADQNGFSAVWTPERHFQTFGGLYPNPGVLGAALAAVTRNVQIRAGSLVLPLHHPIRVTEDWAIVDNLSHGRAAISFATGWHEHDYVIAPHAYSDRRERMFQDIALIRRLWRGEEVPFPGVRGQQVPIRVLPRPVQPELPFWITASSSQTWIRAGETGANVLTALAGGSLHDLRRHIEDYRRVRSQSGHDPRSGIVSLMLHTYIGEDLETVRTKVRQPLKDYLLRFVDQFRPLQTGLADSSAPELQQLLDMAFDRYFEDHSLLGTHEKCAAMIAQLTVAGVDEVACLIDFGIDLPSTLTGLGRLADLRRSLNSPSATHSETAVRG